MCDKLDNQTKKMHLVFHHNFGNGKDISNVFLHENNPNNAESDFKIICHAYFSEITLHEKMTLYSTRCCKHNSN